MAFKCMRKRLIFETLHLDVEGGVSERRTTPSSSTIAMEGSPAHDHNHATVIPDGDGPPLAAVQVQLEQVQLAMAAPQPATVAPADMKDPNVKKVKVKKRVAFTSERPDLYDF